MKKNALLCTIMDVSGSVGKCKRKLAKRYLNMFQLLLESKYTNVENTYIGHTTVAKHYNSEEELFDCNKSGGTYISSGLDTAIKELAQTDQENYDIYVINFSDGDNWGEDNLDTVDLIKKITRCCSLYQFVKISNDLNTSLVFRKIEESLKEELEKGEHKIWAVMTNIQKSQDIINAMNDFVEDESLFGNQPENTFERLLTQKHYEDNNDVEKIEHNGIKTIVKLKNGAIGVSECSDGDAYNEVLGFEVAYARARFNAAKKVLRDLINSTK